MKSLATALVVLAAFALCACPRPVVTLPDPVIETPKPPPIRVPEGCVDPQLGIFVHAQNKAFRYRAEDDGGTLLLFVERPMSDGGLAQPNGDGGTVISLQRTPHGFSGVTDAVVFTQRGVRCRVSFPTELAACSDGGLLLRSAASTSVDETCRAPSNAPASPRIEQRLVRVDLSSPVAPDAGGGRPDAGDAPSQDGGG